MISLPVAPAGPKCRPCLVPLVREAQCALDEDVAALVDLEIGKDEVDHRPRVELADGIFFHPLPTTMVPALYHNGISRANKKSTGRNPVL